MRLRGIQPPCIAPALSACIAAYCFGDLSASRREQFERHLMDCEECWFEVRQLDSAIAVLRSQSSAAIGGLQISRSAKPRAQAKKVPRVRIGHATLSALLYGAYMAVAVAVETAYRWEELASRTLVILPFVVAWIAGTTLGGAYLARRAVVRERGGPFLSFAGVLIAAALGLHVALVLAGILPPVPVTEAGFGTMTAQVAFLKSILYGLLMMIPYVVGPFVIVEALRHRFTVGQHVRLLVELGRSDYLHLARVPFFRKPWLLGGLIVYGLVGFVMMTHLFENLAPNPNLNLFQTLVMLKFGLVLALGLNGLRWYAAELAGIRREAVLGIERADRVLLLQDES